MTELQIKNETIGQINIASSGFEKIIGVLNNIYSIKLPNMAETYRDKMIEFELFFKNNNMSLYKDNILGDIIWNHFNVLINKSAKLTTTIVNNLSDLPQNYLLRKLVIKLNFKYVKNYEKLNSKLSAFSIEKDLNKCIKEFFKNKPYSLCKAGWFKETYANLKRILIKLNLFTEELDREVMPIIELRESQINFLYECASEEMETDSKEDIEEYISNLVDEVKTEMNDKQKKLV